MTDIKFRCWSCGEKQIATSVQIWEYDCKISMMEFECSVCNKFTQKAFKHPRITVDE